MINLKKERVFWSSRPSALLYSGTYLLSLITLICCFRLEEAILPGDYQPGYMEFLLDYLWVTPLRNWPFHNPTFVGTFILQCIEIVVTLKSAYRFLQTQFTQYTLTNQRLIIKSVSLKGFTAHEVDLYRIADLSLIKPIPGMLLGLTDIELYTNDSFMPHVLLEGVMDGKQTYKMIKDLAFKNRERYQGQSDLPLPILKAGNPEESHDLIVA